MSFLPKQYKSPSNSGGYMKFQQGKNKFRILSEAIVGMEVWTLPDGEGKVKPLRFKMGEAVTGDFKDQPKHFWAFIVWNYQTGSCEILEITQKSIQQAIKALVDDSDWGDPHGYDINVTREGEGMETRYTVMPGAAKAVDSKIEKAYKDANINIEALFDGLDPFTEKTPKQLEGKDIEEETDLDDLPPF